MGLLLANNAATTLAADITSGATSLTVADASRFPAMVAGDYLYATLSDASETTWEIVKVTARSGASFTITRGQDGTTAAAWTAGSRVSIRPTAQLVRDLLTKFTYAIKTTGYTLTADDRVILADATAGALTITLPSAASVAGCLFVVKKIDGTLNAITLGGTIDELVNFKIVSGNGVIAFMSDGSGYKIVWMDNIIEYVSNNGTGAGSGTASNTTYTPSVIERGSSGSVIPAVAILSTTSTLQTVYKLPWINQATSRCKVYIEFSNDSGVSWRDLLLFGGGVDFMVRFNNVAAGCVLSPYADEARIVFGNAGRTHGTTYGTGGNDWAAVNGLGWRYRVVKRTS